MIYAVFSVAVLGIGRVVRGGVWLYGSSIVNNVSGFFYWMLITVVGGSGVIGVTSAIVGFASLISGLISFGVGVGVQRFLGKYIGENNYGEVARYFWSTTIFMFLIYSCVGMVLYVLGSLGYGLGGVSPIMLQTSSIIVFLGFTLSFNSLLVSYLKTGVVLLSAVIGNVLKFIVGVSLVYYGWGWIGAVLGYVCVSLTGLMVYSWYSFKLIGFKPTISLNALRNVLTAGFSSWLPSIVLLAGQWIGVLVVFGVAGAVATGYYYVAFAISSVVLMISGSMLSLLLPVLSGMGDGRKRASWRILRICLVFTFPIAVFLMVYPWLPLNLLGGEYVVASSVLFILLLSTLPIAIARDVFSLVYAYGFYGYVLGVGLAQNIPRILLYFTLTPMFGGLGAALSYTFGGFTGLLAALWVAYRINFRIGWRDIAVIVAVPGLAGLVCWLFGLHWLLGVLAIFGFSLIGYAKLNVLTRSDLRELSYAFISKSLIDRFYVRFKLLIDLLFSS